MNKTFSNLKMKQKDKITAWVYEKYKKYVTENDRIPDKEIVNPGLAEGKDILIVGHGAMNLSIVCQIKGISIEKFWSTVGQMQRNLSPVLHEIVNLIWKCLRKSSGQTRNSVTPLTRTR
jgi:hypothetical protein